MAAVYTLLCVAPISAAESIALDVDAMDCYPNAWLKGIGDLELVELWSVLEPDNDAGTLMGDFVYSSPDDEVMVMAVPSQFVALMCNISDDQLAKVAHTWHDSEFIASGSVADVTAALREIHRVSKASAASGHPVLQLASL